MATKADDLERERRIVRDLIAQRSRLMRHEKATPRYWNCDDWGSGQGHREAAEWVETELANWLRKRLAATKK